MKKYTLIACFLLLSGSIVCAFDVKIIKAFDRSFGGDVLTIENKLYFVGSNKEGRTGFLFEIDTDTGSRIQKPMPEDYTIIRIFTQYKDSLIVYSRDMRLYKRMSKEVSLNDFSYKESDVLSYIYSVYGRDEPPKILSYQNDQFLVQYGVLSREDGTGKNSVALLDYRKKTQKPFWSEGELYSLSPDKLHALQADLAHGTYCITNLETGKRTNISGLLSPVNSVAFLSNTLVLIPAIEGDGGYFCIYTLDGKKVAAEPFSVKPSTVFPAIAFNACLTRAVGQSVDSRTSSFLDTTPFRDWLLKNNLLFRPTTATATESQVRVRENPNLEAPVYGALTRGDELEVLDRSGIKVKIGDTTDWWYKVKRKSDGLSGWAYGAFLKLASYQGELGPKPVVDER